MQAIKKTTDQRVDVINNRKGYGLAQGGTAQKRGTPLRFYVIRIRFERTNTYKACRNKATMACNRV
jgi:hypothetical protein